ncbi:nucleoside hydrolase [Pelagicoccus sp. SDUM812003]|uniref:nucleoside hydrolase n=1 Tax=Pelagicoccus sp. SDUM812003 TaxID=3041267 RepID=UPI00280D3382|nr:nucleoside hydrolase [Pelagicoccus sp. SDUM812003]MDQ8205246.1 nucleoside hydrolase [Pelagicoccus sp. SDUM812003]
MKTIIFSLVLLIGLPTLDAAPKPTVLSTDIGGDIDDTWALAHLLRSPELKLDLLLTETGEPAYRASVAAKLLERAERADVEIALGSETGKMKDQDRHQGPWVEDYQLGSYPGAVHQDGVQAFIDYVRNSEADTITVIAIGPAPNLAEAVARAPDVARKCELFGMHGSIDVGYDGATSPSAEYNVVADVPAFRKLMAAPWKSVSLTPLDTCGLMLLEGSNYQKIWRSTDDALLRSVIENYCIWAPRVPWMECDFFTQKTSTLFDDVAVLMAYSNSFLEYETIRFSVSDEGYTVRDPNGPFTARFAIRWDDMSGFQDWLTQRLLGRHADGP